jgi:NAD(P)H-flavin reductase
MKKGVLTPKILHVHLALLDPPAIQFRAGQFLQFVIAPRVLRQYSICSPPSRSGEVELCVDVTPGGAGSQFITALRDGDAVRFRGPFGVFIVSEGEQRPLEFVATGAGIAPLRSMIYDLLERRENVSLRLLFGNRSEDVLMYDQEFRELAARDPRFRYVPTLSRPSAEWTGERGRVMDVLQRWNDFRESPFYLCGSPAMVDDTRRILKARDVPPQDIHFEKFT